MTDCEGTVTKLTPEEEEAAKQVCRTLFARWGARAPLVAARALELVKLMVEWGKRWDG